MRLCGNPVSHRLLAGIVVMAAKLRWGSGILLALCVVGWVIALGGLGSINW
jgi:hypothetical protein